MTTNQIAYWRLQEDKRANAAREAETYRSNVAREGETNRSNLVNEEVKVATQAENVRHNQMTELLASRTAKETERSNKAREVEANRHNVVSEDTDKVNALVKGVELIPKTITSIGKFIM
jgi:hypothetical protein